MMKQSTNFTAALEIALQRFQGFRLVHPQPRAGKRLVANPDESINRENASHGRNKSEIAQ
jgi:hypothetical protein